MTKYRKHALFGLAMAGVGAGLWVSFTGDQIEEGAMVVPLSSDISPVSLMPAPMASSSVSIKAAPEPSQTLRGTQVDGAIRWNQQGLLQVDLPLRRVFDYFLTLVGEEDLASICQRLFLYASELGSAEQVQQVMDLFDDYLRYKAALDEVPQHDGSLQGMMDIVRNKYALAEAELGPEVAQAFFADEQAFDDVALEYVEALREGVSDPDELQHIMAVALLDQPQELSEQMLATSKPALVEARAEAIRQEGASESQVWQLREQELGVEAADRLAKLDQQRALWQQRYEEYRQQRILIDETGFSEHDRQQAIDQLRQDLFSPIEAQRVEVLDRLQQ